jgi:hypothetical protein
MTDACFNIDTKCLKHHNTQLDASEPVAFKSADAWERGAKLKTQSQVAFRAYPIHGAAS